MVYILLSVVLMSMDQRGGYVPRIRNAMESVFEPVFHLAVGRQGQFARSPNTPAQDRI